MFFEGFGKEEKILDVSTKFSKHCQISNCSKIWKDWCFGSKHKNNVSATPKWSIDVENGIFDYLSTI